MTDSHRDTGLLVLIVLVAFGLRVWGLGFGLPFTYHPDEHQYVDAALTFLGGDLNPHQFNNPALLKYTLGALYGLWYLAGRALGAFASVADFQAQAVADPSATYLLARLVSALAGTTTVLVTYAIGRRAYGRAVGLLAAAYLALAFLHVRDSHYAVNDVPATLLSTLALYFSLRVLQQGARRDYLLAGACVGLSAATKYTGLLAIASLLLAHFLARGRRPTHQRLLAGLAAIGVAFLAVMPYALLDWPTFAADVGLLAERGAGGFKGLRLAETSGWIFYVETLAWGLGWPLLLAALAGLALTLTPPPPLSLSQLWERERGVQGGVGEGLVLLAFPLLLYVYLSPQLLLFGRFILPAVPVLAVLAARAVAGLPPVRARPWLLAAAVALALPSAADAARHDLLLTRPDTRALAKAWVETHIPEGTKIIAEAYGPELSGGEVIAPRSQRVYDLTVVGTTSLPKKPVTFYRDQGFIYVVVSSFSYERVLLDEEANRERRAFYTSLDAEAELVQEFRPAPVDLPFRFDQIYGPTTDLWLMERPGPVVKIYRLR